MIKISFLRNKKIFVLIGLFLAFLLWIGLGRDNFITDSSQSNSDKLTRSFENPPDTARPGVYWYFMDGNLSRKAMTKDLESMKKAGIGRVIFLEVNVGVPRGSVNFLSKKWQELFQHAVGEAERLDIELIMGVGPGWAGSGGPWVPPEESMRHLVVSSENVTGPGMCHINLSEPSPRRPFFGEKSLSPKIKKQWNNYYEDVVVLAFPTPDVKEKINDIDEKALYYRAPYSSREGVKPYLPAPADWSEISEEASIPEEQIVDVSQYMEPDGSFSWSVPEGEWTIMRFGMRNNGSVTRPAPKPGLGFECDKFRMKAFDHHFDAYLAKLIEKTNFPKSSRNGGWTRIHLDSWEMGAQNWTDGFREKFQKSRGYDPLPFLPTYSGDIVESLEISERFLWDMRVTSQELILKNYVGRMKELGKNHGFRLSIEPYDMNPTADLALGSLADVPMCEFWSKGYGFNTSYSVIEATSIAHVKGQPVVAAEAFTADPSEAWKQFPEAMKNQGDWAFCAGINRFLYHTFAHKPLDKDLRPGMTMGPYGVHWDRKQTWWPMAEGYHRYVSRCQHMLQQGNTVADILYLTPEGAPHIFRPPSDALIGGDTLPDRRGYNFDGVSPGTFVSEASVNNHKIIFPGGASYHILVLPLIKTMTPELLEKIESLIDGGAFVVGSPPVQSPSLVNYPECDKKVKRLAGEIWRNSETPSKVRSKRYGEGKIFWGGELSEKIQGNLYPSYDATNDVLNKMGVLKDFTTTGPVRYTHRQTKDRDIYFVSNRSNHEIQAKCVFRVDGRIPELWNPLTGNIRALPEYNHNGKRTTIPLQFDAHQSFFVVFPKSNEETINGLVEKNFPAKRTMRKLEGPWDVSFDPEWGGPEKVVFDSLIDWTKRPEKGIKYYSGIASYNKTFKINDLEKAKGALKQKSYFIDLGKVNCMARVLLNGKDLGVVWTEPWQMNITKALQEGENNLEIRVANLWVNRLIGDEFKPDDGIKNGQWPDWLLEGTPRTSDRYTFTTHRYYTRESKLIPSGLLGPVAIQSIDQSKIQKLHKPIQ